MTDCKRANWHVVIITIFPEMFPGHLVHSLAGRALNRAWSYETINLHPLAQQANIDDTAYGGGNSGLVMQAEPVAQALDQALAKYPQAQIIYFSPKGQLLQQAMLEEYAQDSQELILLCGRFEALDQRILDYYPIQQISLGDFILAGGEVAALAFMDGCIRLLPGVVSNRANLDEESFGAGAYRYLLEYPQYTKPKIWRNLEVPSVLYSGDHAKVKAWQLAQAKQDTQKFRPDLWHKFSNNEKK